MARADDERFDLKLGTAAHGVLNSDELN